MIRRHLLLTAAISIAASQANAQMIFNITNGGGANSNMITGINQAAALWSAQLGDNITINIQIKAAALANGVIAHTDTFYDPYSYASVRAALITDRRSADDFSAANHLQSAPAFSMLINRTANNPNGIVSATPYFDTGLGGAGQAGAENNSTIRMGTANAKALGLAAPNTPGLLDGIITVSTAVSFDYNRANGITPGTVDYVGVLAHEIGHLMGFTSGVDILAGNSAAPGLNDHQLKFVTTLDLFRFSSRSIAGGDGVIDWADDDFAKYFSVNGGTTAISQFSTGSVFEASHWNDNLGLGIMDPTAGGGELLAIASNDIRAFDVIGYDLVPEPATALMLLVGTSALLLRSRRRLSAIPECTA